MSLGLYIFLIIILGLLVLGWFKIMEKYGG